MSNRPPLTVAVLRGDDVVFAMDVAGQVLPPDDAEMRAPVALALAQAAAALAMLPPPSNLTDQIQSLGDMLAGLDTPEARSAVDRLTEVAASLTNAIEAGNALCLAALPTAH